MRRFRRTRLQSWLVGIGCGAGLALTIGVNPAWAAALATISNETLSDMTNLPQTGTTNVAPQVMLTISRDHQLHYKLYNDYTNLDNSSDGSIETTYTHAITYYGYFDSSKCYTYSTANGRFEPAALANSATNYCNPSGTTNQWSGNFLNWVSMTRMDAVRKLLFGGLRSSDTGSLTVLERAYLPADAHAFAKYYGGSDLAQLMPFTDIASSAAAGTIAAEISSNRYFGNNNGSYSISSINTSGTTATVTTSSAHGFITNEAILMAGGSCNSAYLGVKTITVTDSTHFTYSVSGSPGNCSSPGSATTATLLLPLVATSTQPVALGDEIYLQRDSSNYMYAVVTSLLNSSAASVNSATSGTVYMKMTSGNTDASNIRTTGSGTSSSMTITDLNTTGVSFCNVTRGASSGANQLSQTNTNPPLLKVARGNFSLWSANERAQCYWSGEATVNGNSTVDQQGGFGGGLRSNGNRAADSGINASAENPVQNVHGVGSGSNESGTTTGEFIVRVKTCDSTLFGSERCKLYPAGNYKPVGLLQVYGDDNRIYFGLMMPSYDKNISGGQLRNGINSLNNEINYSPSAQTGDGTFPTPSSTTKGLIWNLSKLRPYGYSYSDGGYMNSDNCTYQLTGLVTSGGSNSQGSAQNEGNCTSWGNPIGEAYVESLRYLAGMNSSGTALAADTRFGGTTLGSKDSAIGLTVASWADPLSNQNYCASLNVLDFNASVSSYDNDQANLLSDLAGSPSVTGWTTALGTDEGINGTSRLVGSNGVTSDGACTAKTVSDLATATGICPEAPTFKGSYLMDGAAYFAHTKQIRTRLPNCTSTFVPGGSSNSCTGNVTVSSLVPSTDTKSLKVDTYGIQLATNVPKITIPVPNSSKTITIQPAYRLTVGGSVGPGSIVDFKLVNQDLAAGTGKFYINWEDSGQGGDYDQDEWGTISYAIDTAAQTIKVTTVAIAASTANGQGFGYVISGTSKDGPHFHSGIYGFNYTDPTPINVYDAASNTLLNNTTPYTNGSDAGGSGGINSSGGCNNCSVLNPATYVTYSYASGTTASSLQDPLWYAAKYGGFKNSGGTQDATFSVDRPDIDSEWSTKTAGVPDNYFFVTNPAQLEASLKAALDAIVAKTTSGTAAAVVANAIQGQGAAYQALFETARSENATGKTVKWIGTLHALFVDENGNLREDGNGDGILQSDLATDPKVQIYFDDTDRSTKVKRDSGSGFVSNLSLDTLKPIWNARKQLAGLTDTGTQRSYGTAATGTDASHGRYIFTFLDTDRSGIATTTNSAGTNQVGFVPATFSNNNFGILNVTTPSDGTKLVNWVRGAEDATLRNRTLDYYNNGTQLTMRLGDIVNSTPTIVNAPQEAFDLFYNDQTYTKFRQTYRNRRTVVYVGANDGMLHAFNGGFFDASNKAFLTQPASGTNPAPSPVNGSPATHPLGAELWAYVPFNLLPQLTWLSDPAYAHSWYMDAKPRVFDARVFASDATHPNGWGTVMVAGMRFGGAQISLNSLKSLPLTSLTSFGVTTGTAMTNKPSSAYVIMDITDPEQAPVLIAEITDASLGFTTSYPTVMAFSQRSNTATSSVVTGNQDKWYLVFGSGPTGTSSNFDSGNSSSSAKLYVWDLRARAGVTSGCTTSNTTCYPYDLGTSNFGNMFVGDPVSVDWDLDFKADALYFGAVGTDPGATGSFVKMNLQDTTVTTGGVGTSDKTKWVANPDPTATTAAPFITNLSKPVVSTPTVSQDEAGCRWVLGGTGRFFQKNDKSSSTVQSLFGAIDGFYTNSTGVCSSTSTYPVPAAAKAAIDFTAASGTNRLLDISSVTITQDGTVSGGPTGATTEDTLVNNTSGGSGTGTRNLRGWKRTLTSGTPSERSVSTFSLLGDVLFASVFTPANTQCQGDGSGRLFGVYYKTGVAKANLSVPLFSTGTVTNSTTLNSYVSLGTGLTSAPGLHLGQLDQANPQVTVFTQTSTGAITTNQTKAKRLQSGEIDWRGTHR